MFAVSGYFTCEIRTDLEGKQDGGQFILFNGHIWLELYFIHQAFKMSLTLYLLICSWKCKRIGHLAEDCTVQGTSVSRAQREEQVTPSILRDYFKRYTRLLTPTLCVRCTYYVFFVYLAGVKCFVPPRMPNVQSVLPGPTLSHV